MKYVPNCGDTRKQAKGGVRRARGLFINLAPDYRLLCLFFPLHHDILTGDGTIILKPIS